jgi:PAS domain S-box-containing protein
MRNAAGIESALRSAVEAGQLRLEYQARVDIRTGEVVGAEALLRWDHPELGAVPPSTFIPIAEESGLILGLGEWALREACAQAARWRAAGRERLVVSVNLSPRQFVEGDIANTVQAALSESGLPPSQLELEITEGMTLDVESAVVILRSLRQLGVQISVDDFGTGYCSLAYLKRLPLHTLKIDKTFIRDCTSDENDATIVKTIVSMAHHLNLRVVAEGVETKEQLAFLQRNLCDEAQGFLFQRPSPPEELERELSAIPRIVSAFGAAAAYTEKMWMQEQLRTARRELEEALRMQHGLTFKYKKADGRFVFTMCEGQILRRLGIVSEQVVGKDPFEFLAAEEAAELAAQYQRAWDGEEEITFEAPVMGIWCLATLAPIRRGGAVVEVIGSTIDITERKRAEEELHRLHKQYKLIVENVTDLIAIFDAKGNLAYVSPSHLRVLGRSPESLLGMDVELIIHPEDVSVLIDAFRKAVGGRSGFRLALRFRHASGSWVTVDVQGMPVTDERGELLQMVTVAREVAGQ